MKNKIWIYLIIIFAVSTLFLAGNYVSQHFQMSAFQEGLQQGQIQIIQEVQQGNIPVVMRQGNSTQVIWRDISEICIELNQTGGK